MGKLTKRLVDAAVPREAPYFVWCSDLKGFGVRVFPSGQKTYVADYRTGGGTRRRMSIGPHGKLTTEEARKQALAVLGSVVKGNDPSDERAKRRAAITVKTLCARYLEAADRGLILGKGNRPKKPSTIDTDKGRVARHIVPLLGSKAVVDLTAADINRFIRDVASGKTAIVEKTGKLRGKAVVDGGTGTATRTTGLLGGILSFAVSEGIIATNPARGVRRPADGRRKRRLTIDELGTLGAALEAARRGGEHWQGLVAIRLLALTGSRFSEITELEWSEVDLPGHALRLDDSKEGAGTRAIGQPVVDILRALPRMPGCRYVFPPARAGAFFGSTRNVLDRIVAKAELGDLTSHTLRHTFTSVASDLGYADSTVGAMVGHAGGTVTSRYIHKLDSTLIAAADRVAEAIADAMAAGKPSLGSAVDLRDLCTPK